MSKTDRNAAVTDISEILCDACLARLEQWLAGETTTHEFLEALLILGEEPNLERFFCPRCTKKLNEVQAGLLSHLAPRNAGETGIPTPGFDNMRVKEEQ